MTNFITFLYSKCPKLWNSSQKKSGIVQIEGIFYCVKFSENIWASQSRVKRDHQTWFKLRICIFLWGWKVVGRKRRVYFWNSIFKNLRITDLNDALAAMAYQINCYWLFVYCVVRFQVTFANRLIFFFVSGM